MIPISTLKVTQSYLRNPNQILGMIEYLWKHGDFSDLDRKIIIKQLDDDEYYIHDGHHRILALYMAYSWDAILSDDEFVLKQFKYEDFQKVNWECGWLTPLDIRKETRFPCVAGWKNHIKTVVDMYGRSATEDHIYLNGEGMYKELRRAYFIRDFYKQFLREQLQ